MPAYIKAETGLVIDPNTVFDVQVKRFHAYKRQLMNIMKVMDIYNRRIADPNFHVTPTTFIFSGKAASSYTFAKETSASLTPWPTSSTMTRASTRS